jgi:hypothetical protein
MIEHKYHSPFKRVCVNESGGEKIKKLQEDFDAFWRKVNRIADKCPEKFHAQKAMQEACMWLTRATALQHQRIERPVGEVIIDDPLNTKYSEHALDAAPYLRPHQEDIAKALEKYQSGDRIHIKNRPTIIIKKK